MKIMELFKNINTFLKKISNSQGKNINTLFIYLLIGVIILTAGSILFDSPGSERKAENTVTNLEKRPVKEESSIEYKHILEKQLKDILSCINGVGRVEIMITLDTDEEIQPAYNISETRKNTEEKDTQGGIRNIAEFNSDKKVVIVREQGGNEKPVVVKEIKPRVKGVIVVAEGAENSAIEEKLTKAVKTVLNIPVYKIKVLPMKK
jgi:stage III sporulation protein AG